MTYQVNTYTSFLKEGFILYSFYTYKGIVAYTTKENYPLHQDIQN